MLKIGETEISKCYLGNGEVSKIYLGSDLVYEKQTVPSWVQTENLEHDGVITSIDPDAGNGSIKEVGTGLAGVWAAGYNGINIDTSNYVYSINSYSSSFVRFKFPQLMKFKRIRAYGMCTNSSSLQNSISIWINKEGNLQTGIYDKNGGANTAFEILFEKEKEGDEVAINLKSSNSPSGTNGYKAFLYSLQVEADYA